jgi:hypothetical protein
MKFNVPTEGVINCGKNERHFKVAENLEALIFKKIISCSSIKVVF